jgi:lipid-binding SYLF domain-containing protein
MQHVSRIGLGIRIGQIGTRLILPLVVAGALLGGCDTGGSYRTAAERSPTLEQAASNAVARFRETEPSMKPYFETAAGYAIFPEVAKGGLILGGARGDGVLFEGGRATHYVTLTAGSIGAQIGGQVFREIIFFETQSELDTFKSGNFEFDAGASAVAARAGGTAAAAYTKGVAVFVSGERGLMAEASVGGQQFDVRAIAP